MGDLFTWWMGLGDPVKAATVTAAVTLFSALAGICVLAWQLGRQSKNAVRQNQRNEALKLKVQIYESVVETSAAGQAAALELSNFLLQVEMQFRYMVWIGDSVKPPPQRYTEYQRLMGDASSAFINVMTMVERWQVVDRRLSIFRRVMGMGLDAHREVAFGGPDPLMYALPVTEFMQLWNPPAAPELERLYQRLERERYEIGRLGAWVHDFQIEMQMLLLGELFPEPVERRDPPDPQQFCVRLDRYDDIERRINESPWGVRAAESEASAWANFTNAQRRGPG